MVTNDNKRPGVAASDNKRLVLQQAPKYLGAHLDRMLNFGQHLDNWQARSRLVSLIRRLADKHVEHLSKHYGSPLKPWHFSYLS